MPKILAKVENHQETPLRSREFQMFTIGNLSSSMAEWIDIVALNWVMLQITNSPLMLAVINACRLIPVFLLSYPAGILADYYERRKLLIWIQMGAGLFTALIGVMLYYQYNFWLIALIVVIRSILLTMDPPIRNALIPNLVDTKNLANALALTTTIASLSRIIGPAFAGVLLTMLDPPILFGIGATGFMLESLVLCFVSTKESVKNLAKKSNASFPIGRDVLDFFQQNPSLQPLLILLIVPMVFLFPYTSMIPVFVKDLLQAGPDTVGVLLSAAAVGALLGSFLLSIRNELVKGKSLIVYLFGFSISWTLFLFAPTIQIAAIWMFAVGLTSQMYRTSSRIIIQLQVPDSLRGRIMSIVLMDRGFIPLGALLIGWVMDRGTVLGAGLMMGLGSVLITLLLVIIRPQLWRIES